ncbi:NAD(P)-dependent oxidoreductase [Atopobacter phocae]|uniref:NAD(P)-dependent oxidoreductase n=1 Tax=Atopobacter phocae TaxID=136492 RepID=UPI0004ACD005
MDYAKKLKVISINATGYDNVDLEEANKRSIGVCPVGEYATKDVAEFTISMMLTLIKNMKEYTYDVEKNYKWRYDFPKSNKRVEEMTLGIFGLGKIGKEVAKKAINLGMKVIAYDPYVNSLEEKLDVRMVDLHELLAEADVISNHMNLNETNYEIFNYKMFKKMKKKPYFINMGRGASIVENDLVRALDEELLRGAGLDLLADETPNLKIHPLVGKENVIITPHAAFYTSTSIKELQRISTENIVNYLNDEKQKVFKLVSEN